MYNHKSRWEKVDGMFLAVHELMIEVKIYRKELQEVNSLAENRDTIFQRMETTDANGKETNEDVIFRICGAETCYFCTVHFSLRTRLVVCTSTHVHTCSHTHMFLRFLIGTSGGFVHMFWGDEKVWPIPGHLDVS